MGDAIHPDHQAILDVIDGVIRRQAEAAGEDPDLILLEMDEFGEKALRGAGLRPPE